MDKPWRLWAMKQLYENLPYVSTRQFSGVSYLFNKRLDLLKGHRA